MSAYTIHDVEQGSEKWRRVRMGIPTASMLHAIMATGRSDPESKTRAKYMRQLAYEIITGEPMETYSNARMDLGKKLEPEAVSLYQMMADVEVERIGFVTLRYRGDRMIGASPDGLVGIKGGVEIKTEDPHLLIARLEAGAAAGFPAEHVAQCAGNMWALDRDWWDLAIFYPRLPMFRRTLRKDSRFLARIEIAVEAFLDELETVVEKVRRG